MEPHFLPDLAEKVIEEINEIEPEIVVVTGDLTCIQEEGRNWCWRKGGRKQ